MKSDIHPKYVECQVTCGCGETFVTRSTRPEIKVEISTGPVPEPTKIGCRDPEYLLVRPAVRFAGSEHTSRMEPVGSYTLPPSGLSAFASFGDPHPNDDFVVSAHDVFAS